MAYFTAAKHGAIYPASVEVDLSHVDICPHTKRWIQFTFSAAKHIAIGVLDNWVDGTLKAYYTSINGDGRETCVFIGNNYTIIQHICLTHIAIFRTAIHVSEHMATRNQDIGVNTDMASIFILKQALSTSKNITWAHIRNAILISHTDGAVIYHNIGAATSNGDVTSTIDITHQYIVITVYSDRWVTKHSTFVAPTEGCTVVESLGIAAVQFFTHAIDFTVTIDIEDGIATHTAQVGHILLSITIPFPFVLESRMISTRGDAFRKVMDPFVVSDFTIVSHVIQRASMVNASQVAPGEHNGFFVVNGEGRHIAWIASTIGRTPNGSIK